MKGQKVTKQKITALFFGVLLDAMGVALVTKSDLGVSAVSSVAYILSCAFPRLSFGVWSYIYQFILFAIMCLLVKKCTGSYMMSFLVGVVFGYTLDFCRMLIGGFPVHLGMRFFYYFAGTGILIVGVAFLMISDLPIMPQDLFTREISVHFSLPFKGVKTLFDLTCVTLSLAISVGAFGKVKGIGIGTLISALIIGKCVDDMKQFLLKSKVFSTMKA